MVNTFYASSVGSSTGWTNPTNAEAAPNGNFATASATAPTDPGVLRMGGFNIAATIPAGSTINSVTIGYRYTVTESRNSYSHSIQCYLAGLIGSAVTDIGESGATSGGGNGTTADVSGSAGTITVTQLRDAAFSLDHNVNASGTRAYTFSTDSVWVTVDWTPPAPPSGAASGAANFVGAATGFRTPVGAPTGTITLAGSTTGARVSAGAPSGTMGWAGSATGSMPKHGDASGSLSWEGSSTGSRSSSGEASGDLSWAGSAEGSQPSSEWGPVTGLYVVSTGNDTVDLAWDALATAESYQVERDGAVLPDVVMTTSFHDVSLTPGQEYTYRVRAVK